MVQLSHPYMTNGKTIALTRQTFASKVMSLLFNMLSIGHNFSSKEQMYFNFMAAVTICSDFGAQKYKVWHCFHCFLIYFHEVMGPMPWSSFSECWALSQLFRSPLLLSSRGFLAPLHFLPKGWCHLPICGYWYFSWQTLFQLVLHPIWISHDVLCIEVKLARWQYTALAYSFPNFEAVHCSMSGSNCCFLTCIQISS